jgi:phage baseplate assembly protein W|tara:strand:+ start:144 stop:551 length:408 start_codon:yes stop_codon:yes gene_type:complete
MASTIENDLNPNTYVGLSFPLGHSGGGLFNRSKTLVEQARHNLKNLLLTNLGERAHQPEFGSRLLEVVFEFKDDALIEQVINEAVDKWLPYITINAVTPLVDSANPNRLNVSVDFSVTTSPDAKNEIVLDFNTTG